MTTNSSYTPEELTLAVEAIVRSAVRYEYGALGTRKDDTSFGDLQDAVSGLFLSLTNSPYYVVSLARDRLQALAETVIEAIDVLLRYTTALGRTSTGVTKTSSLNNAKSALEALALATAQRTGIYQSLGNIPAYLRFEKNTQKFLDEEGQKVNHKGGVIETAEEARLLIKPAAVSLRSQYDELVRKAGVLSRSIPDFQSLNLPARLSQSIMSRASEVLGESISSLEGLDPIGRLAVLKELVLNVLAARATVRGFGALEPPTTFLLLEGTGYLYADSTHPATPASLMADVDGGYVVGETASYLSFLVDGSQTISYPPPGSYLASLDLVGTWPREVFSGTTRFSLRRETESLSHPFYLDLPPALYEAADFMREVNTQLGVGTSEVRVSLRSSSPRTTQEVSVTGVGPVGVTFTAGFGVDFDALGVVPGDFLYVADQASSGYQSVYALTGVSPGSLIGNRTHGSSSGGEIDVEVLISPRSGLYPSIGLVNFTSDVGERASLSIEDVDQGTSVTLGQASSARTTCARTPAKGVSSDLNVQSYTWVTNANRMDASYLFIPSILPISPGEVSCRSHPEDPTSISFYLYRGEARVVANGLNAQVEIRGIVGIPFSYLNKALIVRGTNQASDVNNHGVLTLISTPVSQGVVVDVLMQNPLTALVGEVVDIEIGWDYYNLHGVHRDDFKLVVDAESLQGGTYTIIDKVVSATTGHPLPFQVKVDPAVPGYISGGNKPSYFEAVLGRDRVVFRSLSTGIDSKVVATAPVVDSAHNRFFTANPATAVGTTRWVQLPSWPARIEVGDIMEFHTTSPLVPALSLSIDLVEPSINVVRLSTPVDVDFLSSINFSTNSQVPFTRIRKKVKQNFDVMADALDVWLAQGANDTLSYFRQLDSVLNILLASGNPTLAQVNAVSNKLGILKATVASLTTLLSTYESSVVDEVLTLIKSFRERGADRAIDVLLEGDFQTFFGLSSVESSYAGNLQKTIRDVEREDLVVRNDNRADTASTATASYDDYDPELVMDDVSDLADVDIPDWGSVESGLPS